MPALANLKHERFCHAVAAGETQGQAYKLHVATAAASCKRTTLKSNGAALAVQHHARIAELRQAITDAAEAALILGKMELARYLSGVIMTDPTKLDASTAHYAQEVVIWKDNDGNERKRIKLASKTDCAGQLSKLMGWNEPEKLEHLHAVIIESPAWAKLQAMRNGRREGIDSPGKSVAVSMLPISALAPEDPED